ncbi:hypothetical protein OC834_000659 [Tilletia horrida]|nr:hypothetical protein OC834_000659 [Tilletia horrida]
MVLQNKYKARASAKYNAGRGSAGATRGTRGGRGRGGRGGGRGRGGYARFGDEPDGEEHDGIGEGEDGDEGDGDEEEGEGEDEKAEDAAFPTLQASAARAGSSSGRGGKLGTDADRVPSKYARRKIESNAWRYKADEAEGDPDAEPEPEVDLSALFARVAKLDSSKNAVITLGAGPQASASSASEQAETAEEIEADIDHSLAYLYERERARERARTGRAREGQAGLAGNSNVVDVASLSAEERQKMEAEAEEMKADKEKADALRALKERFQGRAIGERVKTSNVRRLVSTTPAGPASVSGSDPSSRDRGPKPAHLQPERERLPLHARTWGSRRGEEDGEDGEANDFFDEIASPSSRLLDEGSESHAADPATRQAAMNTPAKAALPSAPSTASGKPAAKANTQEMEDFLDAMLG